MSTPAVAAIVGRERELAAVERFLTGGSGALVLDGEAGIGKTTIWTAGVERARVEGRRVLVARPAEAETRLPFAVLADLIEPVLDDAFRVMPVPQRRALEVALVRREAPSDLDTRAVGAASRTVLRALTEDGPVVVAVDDLQWVDAASAAALGYAIRRVSHEGVQLLGTRRAGHRAGLEIAGAERLSVEALEPSAIGRILRARLGVELRRPALLRIAARSGGNPFFALELARDGRLLDDPDAPLPASLDAILRDRLLSAPRSVRDALAVAAAHAAPTAELLARAGVSAAEVDAAVALGFLVVHGDRLRFSHPLIGSAALDLVTPGRRRELHRRLAAAIGDADERAPHVARATAVPDAAVAAEVAAAATRAVRRGAPVEAADLREHAVRLTPPGDRQAVRRRTVDLARALAVAGDAERASGLLERLAEEMLPGPERACVLLELACFAWDDMDVAVATCERAVAEADDAGRAIALVELSSARTLRGEIAEAARLLGDAAPLAERAGDARTLARVLLRTGSLQWSRGEGTNEELIRRAQELYPTSDGPPSLEWQPELFLAEALMLAGEHERARPLYEKFVALARDFGDDGTLAWALAGLANLECRSGHPAAAVALADGAVELARELGEENNFAHAVYWRGRVRALLGLIDDARTDIDEAMAASEGARFELFRICCVDVLGYLALATDRLDDACEHLQHVLDRLHELPWREPAPIDAFHHLGEAHVLLGDLAAAEAVLDELEALARPTGRVRSLAGAARVRGLIAATRGDVDGAVRLLRESLEIQARLPEPHETGRTLLHLGSVLRRANRKRAARDALEDAGRVLDGCGARLWAERARTELDRIGGRPLRTGALTGTEQQIAELVAAGRSNHEVARALSLSPKTVEWNLSKIYRKLHVRSRAELAAKHARREAV